MVPVGSPLFKPADLLSTYCLLTACKASDGVPVMVSVPTRESPVTFTASVIPYPANVVGRPTFTFDQFRSGISAWDKVEPEVIRPFVSTVNLV